MSGVETIERSQATEDAPMRGRRLTEALVPVLFLVPVAIGIAISVVRLVQVRYPAYGWTMNVDADAQAIALGVWPFQDPAHGYTANGYTPLFPVVVSLFDHLYRWSGWSVLVSTAAGAGSAAIIARLAWRRPTALDRRSRALALVEAAGIGALGWSLVFGMRQNGFFDARNDQPTWLAALAAIVLVPAAVRGSRRARVGVVLLVSVAFWVKQPGIAAAAAVAVAIAVAALSGRLSWRAALGMGLAALVLNGALLGLLGLLTDGWQLRWNFGIHLPATRSAGHAVRTLAPRVAPAIVFAAAMGFLAVRAVRSGTRGRDFSGDGLVAVALLALAALGAFEGIYLMRFVAGDDNDALALPWALAGLGALGYKHAAARVDTRAAAAGVCVLLAATTLLGGSDWRLRRGHVIPVAAYPALPDDVTSYAEHHLVYHPAMPLSFLRGREGVYPTGLQVREVLNRSLTPSYLVRALVERRFAGIFGLFAADPTDLVAGALNPGEQNFGWKLNGVIEANYRKVRHPLTIPAGVRTFLSVDPLPMRVPRRTPPALWMAGCFGPFRLGGAEFRIHQGGGFWCRSGRSSIALLQTPAPASQLESVDPVTRLGGRLDIGVQRATGWWSIGSDGGWRLVANVSPRTGARVKLVVPGAKPDLVTISRNELHRSRGVVHLDFDRGRQASLALSAGEDSALRVHIPAAGAATLAIWSSASLGARLNFNATRVEGS